MNYRDLIRFTRNNQLSRNEQLANAALGLCGEAGEVADLIKKHLHQGHVLDEAKLIKEMGDVRWYFELMCDLIDVSIQKVEQVNTNKLLERFPNGFNSAASIHRKPE